VGTAAGPTLAEMIQTVTAIHGPVLNVIHQPGGRPACPVCTLTSPVTVHAHRLVWLRCGHSRPLPPITRVHPGRTDQT
jgi:hypothetical protein